MMDWGHDKHQWQMAFGNRSLSLSLFRSTRGPKSNGAPRRGYIDSDVIVKNIYKLLIWNDRLPTTPINFDNIMTYVPVHFGNYYVLYSHSKSI